MERVPKQDLVLKEAHIFSLCLLCCVVLFSSAQIMSLPPPKFYPLAALTQCVTGTVCYVDATVPETKTVPKSKLELWKSAWCDAAWLSSCFVITQS